MKAVKQILSAGVFAVMLVLTLGTMLAYAWGDDSGGSYSLLIIKELATGCPAGADNKEYVFQVISIDGQETVTICGAGSKIIQFSNAGMVSVVEITDQITDSSGSSWGVTSPCVESHTSVLERKAKVYNSVDNGTITVTRPAAGPENGERQMPDTCFRVTELPLEDDEQSTVASAAQLYEETSRLIGPGGSYTFDNLPRGEYAVEELKAPEGFSVTANDLISVDAGATQTVVIHGSSARMTLNAPGTRGDGHIHYFVINGPGYENVTVSVESEENYALEHLGAGVYTVREWEHPGQERFSVTTPVTTKGAEKIYYYTNFGNYVPNSDYPADRYTYLGLRIGAAVGLPVGTDYTTQIVGTWRDTGVSSARAWTRTGKNTGGGPTDGTIYTLTWYGAPVYLNAGPFQWGVFAVDGMTQAKLRVTPYTEQTSITSYDRSGIAHSVVVDSRGWLTIEKPTDAADHTEYVFSITGPGGYSETVSLHSGQRTTLRNLPAGSYAVKETIKADEYNAFTMDVEDSERTSMDYSARDGMCCLYGTIQGEGKITIAKPAGDDGGRTYSIRIDKQNERGEWVQYAIVTLHAGKTTVQQNLDPGEYRAVPLDVMDYGYTITYLSSSVHVVNGNATMTFTNQFASHEGFYHVIHEYYLDGGDNRYVYEGSSSVGAVRGLPINDTKTYDFQSVDPEFLYGGYEYQLQSHAYGTVTAGTPATAALIDPQEISGDEEPGENGELSNLSETDDENEAPNSENPNGEEARGEEARGEETNGEEAGGEEAGGGSPGDETPPETTGPETSGTQGEPPETPETSEGDMNAGDADAPKPTENPGLPGQPETGDGDMTPAAIPLSDAPLPGRGREFDDNGFISQDTGYGPDKKIPYTYAPNRDMTSVQATANGGQIIILRYVRKDTPSVTGSYHIIHMYYLRDAKGDHFEGSSGLETVTINPLTSDNHGNRYTVDGAYDREGVELPGGGVERRPTPSFNVDGVRYTYVYDGAAYGTADNVGDDKDFFTEKTEDGVYIHQDDAMKHVYATESGGQVIILRYYRTVSGSYNVVHEYYYRERVQDPGDEGPESLGYSGLKDDGGVPAVLSDDQSGDEGFNGTLVSSDGWAYTFVGKTEIERISAPLGQEFTKENVDEISKYDAVDYKYFDVGYGQSKDGAYESLMDRASATATADGDQIIILRYYRQDGMPEEPDLPKETAPPRETAPPEHTENTELPEDGVPRDLAGPDMGDKSNIVVWYLLSGFSGCGFVILIVADRILKKRGK